MLREVIYLHLKLMDRTETRTDVRVTTRLACNTTTLNVRYSTFCFNIKSINQMDLKFAIHTHFLPSGIIHG